MSESIYIEVYGETDIELCLDYDLDIEVSTGDEGPPGPPGPAGPDWQLLVSTTMAVDGALTQVFPELIGKNVKMVFLDGIKLPLGLTDRMSYNFNPANGLMIFSAPIGQTQYLEVYGN